MSPKQVLWLFPKGNDDKMMLGVRTVDLIKENMDKDTNSSTSSRLS